MVERSKSVTILLLLLLFFVCNLTFGSSNAYAKHKRCEQNQAKYAKIKATNKNKQFNQSNKTFNQEYAKIKERTKTNQLIRHN
jgi:cell division protein FtsB